MLNIDVQKEAKINHMVSILIQMDLKDIELLTRDANTLLTRQRIAEAEAYGAETTQRPA